MPTDTPVIGVGNYLLRDDGAGIHAVDRLRERGRKAVDAGTVAMFVMEAMDGAERAVVVDAFRNGGQPGDVHVATVETEEGPPDRRGFREAHGFGFLDALETASTAYDPPDEILLIGVEPKVVEPGVELSEEVESSMTDLLDRVEVMT